MLTHMIFSLFRSSNHTTMLNYPSVGHPSWCMKLTFLIIPSSEIFCFVKHKNSKKKNLIMFLYLAFCRTLSNKTIAFLRQSEEFNIPSYFRSLATSTSLLNSTHYSNGSYIAFDDKGYSK